MFTTPAIAIHRLPQTGPQIESAQAGSAASSAAPLITSAAPSATPAAAKGKSFADHLAARVHGPRRGSETSELSHQPKEPVPSQPTQRDASTAHSVDRALAAYDAQWRSMQTATQHSERSLPTDLRPLIRYQRLAQETAFGMQALSQAGEAIAGTVRRVQQLGSN